jgi:hypothetical protein
MPPRIADDDPAAAITGVDLAMRVVTPGSHGVPRTMFAGARESVCRVALAGGFMVKTATTTGVAVLQVLGNHYRPAPAIAQAMPCRASGASARLLQASFSGQSSEPLAGEVF